MTAIHLMIDVTKPGARDAYRLACGIAVTSETNITRNPVLVTCAACRAALTVPPLRADLDIKTDLAQLLARARAEILEDPYLGFGDPPALAIDKFITRVLKLAEVKP